LGEQLDRLFGGAGGQHRVVIGAEVLHEENPVPLARSRLLLVWAGTARGAWPLVPMRLGAFAQPRRLRSRSKGVPVSSRSWSETNELVDLDGL
jgi:hypothetical protein